MNMFHSAKIVLMAALAPLACSVAAGTADDDVAGLAQPIINGTPVTTENIGLVKIVLASGSGCSGTLITPEWVLTAQHCLPTEPTGTTVERTTTGDVRSGVQAIPFNYSGLTTDVGLIRVAPAFPIAAGANGYTNELWPFAPTALVGKTVDCYGYGYNSTDGTGFGTLRQASLLVSAYDTTGGQYTLLQNSLGQIQSYGDSGSGCFYTEGGKRYDLSVFTNPGGDRAFAYATAPLRAWVDLQVHNSCTDGQQSGTESGIDCGGSCAACPAAATLTLTSEWDSGWCAQVNVTNYTAFPSNSWTVQFDVHQSSLYTQWGANYANSGSLYTATNLGYNGNIPSKQTINFGFCANKTGPTFPPTLVSSVIH